MGIGVDPGGLETYSPVLDTHNQQMVFFAFGVQAETHPWRLRMLPGVRQGLLQNAEEGGFSIRGEIESGDLSVIVDFPPRVFAQFVEILLHGRNQPQGFETDGAQLGHEPSRLDNRLPQPGASADQLVLSQRSVVAPQVSERFHVMLRTHH